MDEAGKVVSDEDAKVTIEGTLEDSEDVEKDDDGQEVIKVYIIKAHPGEDDLGTSQIYTCDLSIVILFFMNDSKQVFIYFAIKVDCI